MNSLARFKYITYKRITKQDVRHGREKYTEDREEIKKKKLPTFNPDRYVNGIFCKPFGVAFFWVCFL